MLGQAILAQLVHKALVVHGLCVGLGSLARACQVHVHVDEARHDVAASQVDANTARKIELTLGRHGFELAVGHHHDQALARLHVRRAVEHVPVYQRIA